MLVLTMVVLMLVLVLQGLPLVFVMGAISVVYMLAADINIAILGQRMISRLDSFLILAIPLFYLAGELMNACKLTDRIVAMA
ncbi:MAG: TRAP transporter large permease subunit, partial [Desulfobulbia bacterium]